MKLIPGAVSRNLAPGCSVYVHVTHGLMPASSSTNAVSCGKAAWEVRPATWEVESAAWEVDIAAWEMDTAAWEEDTAVYNFLLFPVSCDRQLAGSGCKTPCECRVRSIPE